jgi:hypothetical protein
MAAVVFAFGNRPGIDQHDAFEIVKLLARTRNFAGIRAAAKIGSQARRARGGKAVDLDVDEMADLLAMLSLPSATRISDAVTNLRHALVVALSSDDH